MKCVMFCNVMVYFCLFLYAISCYRYLRSFRAAIATVTVICKKIRAATPTVTVTAKQYPSGKSCMLYIYIYIFAVIEVLNKVK